MNKILICICLSMLGINVYACEHNLYGTGTQNYVHDLFGYSTGERYYKENYCNQPIQKYNPYSSTWETTMPDETLKYNPYEDSWKYTDPSAIPTYNPYENKWELP